MNIVSRKIVLSALGLALVSSAASAATAHQTSVLKGSHKQLVLAAYTAAQDANKQIEHEW